MNLSSLIPQTAVQPQLLFSSVPFQFGAVPLQVYVLEGSGSTTVPSVLIQPPAPAVRRSTGYPKSVNGKILIREVTPVVVGVVST